MLKKRTRSLLKSRIRHKWIRINNIAAVWTGTVGQIFTFQKESKENYAETTINKRLMLILKNYLTQPIYIIKKTLLNQLKF